MKNLNKNQWIAVIVGMGILTYLLFSGSIMNLFNLSTLPTESSDAGAQEGGVVIEDVVIGTGVTVESGDTLTVHYVGTLSNGRVFDSSLDRNTSYSFTLGVGSVIRGWDEGLLGMRVGGRRRLVITPEYAYGEQSVGTIPANAILLFEIELLDAQKPASR
jgi:peptidylprolyl isomerase